MSSSITAPAVLAQPAARASTAVKTRIGSIDVMRGLVIVLMLVDHVRERFYYHHQVTDPMDIDVTSPELFFTRLSAHLCAPVFVFLTGLSAWLYSHPASGELRSASGFLFKRGLFLVFVEIVLINFSWMGTYETLWLQVIWVIGLSMIVLSGMVKLPVWTIAATGAIIVFGHNLLTPVHFNPGETGYTIWTILHDRGYLISEGAVKVKISYPLLPWIGVILLGYVLGPLYARTVNSIYRKKILVVLGIACLSLLVVIRGFNFYGETLPWVYGENVIQTLMSFLNYTKYPPSLDFLLLTLGVAFLMLSGFENRNNKMMHVLQTFGSVPMFFYIVHLYMLLAGYRLLLLTVGPNHGGLFGVNNVLAIWIIASCLTFVMYFPTRWFSHYKKRSGKAWIRYF